MSITICSASSVVSFWGMFRGGLFLEMFHLEVIGIGFLHLQVGRVLPTRDYRVLLNC